MPRISPSEQKKQELRNLFEQSDEEATDSQMALSELVRLTTEKTLQEMLELEQVEKLGRARYERRAEPSTMHRNGYEAGTLKTAEGVFRVQLPQIRGAEEPYRSKIWSKQSFRTPAKP